MTSLESEGKKEIKGWYGADTKPASKCIPAEVATTVIMSTESYVHSEQHASAAALETLALSELSIFKRLWHYFRTIVAL